jgi:hypothetical protein
MRACVWHLFDSEFAARLAIGPFVKIHVRCVFRRLHGILLPTKLLFVVLASVCLKQTPRSPRRWTGHRGTSDMAAGGNRASVTSRSVVAQGRWLRYMTAEYSTQPASGAPATHKWEYVERTTRGAAGVDGSRTARRRGPPPHQVSAPHGAARAQVRT